MSGHGTFACVVGQKPPAMSVSWERPKVPGDSGYIVFFADLLPDEPGFDDLPAEPVCLHSLLEDGDGSWAAVWTWRNGSVRSTSTSSWASGSSRTTW